MTENNNQTALGSGQTSSDICVFMSWQRRCQRFSGHIFVTMRRLGNRRFLFKSDLGSECLRALRNSFKKMKKNRSRLFLFITQILLTATCLAQSAEAPAANQTKNPEALASLQTAIQAQFQKDYSKAISAYEHARLLDPTLTGIDYQLAVIAFSQNQPDEARKYLAKSIAAKDGVAASHNLLGVIAGQNKDYDTSIAEFKQAIQISPQDANLHFNLSETYRESGQAGKAIAALNEAIKLSPHESLYPFKLRLARIAAGQGRELESETASQLRESKPSGEWLLTAAAIALSRGAYSDAAILLAHARESMDPIRFFGLIQDPCFKNYISEPSIKPFYDVEITTSPSTNGS